MQRREPCRSSTNSVPGPSPSAARGWAGLRRKTRGRDRRTLNTTSRSWRNFGTRTREIEPWCGALSPTRKPSAGARAGVAAAALEVDVDLRRWAGPTSHERELSVPGTGPAATERYQLATQALTRHRMGARSFSPTALEHFASCPYQFLLQAIHRLAAARRNRRRFETIDPLTRGALFHEVQFRC